MIIQTVLDYMVRDAFVIDVDNIGINFSVTSFSTFEKVLFCIITPFNKKVINVSYCDNKYTLL